MTTGSTPTHIPPAMRGEGVPEWIVIVPIKAKTPCPPFVHHLKNGLGSTVWRKSMFPGVPFTGWDTADIGIVEYARAATPTEITAARDGGEG